MSTQNILSITPMTGGSIAVTFSCHRGGNRTYYYGGSDAAAIMGGADPADFEGSQSPFSVSGSNGFMSIGEAVVDISEIL